MINDNKNIDSYQYLPFYVNDEIFYPIIEYCLQNDVAEAIKLCDAHIELLGQKLSLWMKDGQIKNFDEYVTYLSFAYTKAAYFFEDKNLFEVARQYFLKAISAFEYYDVASTEYCDALYDMAVFQQNINNYAESIAYHTKRINSIARIKGPGSMEVKDAYDQMYTLYRIATSWINFAGFPKLFDGHDLNNPLDYESGKIIISATRNANESLLKSIGEFNLVDCYKHHVENIIQNDQLSKQVNRKIDSIRYGVYPYKRYNGIVAESFKDEAILDLIYGKFNEFKTQISQFTRYCTSYDELAAHTIGVASVCQNLDMIDLSINLMAECFFAVSKDRPDLAELVGANLIPLAASHSHPCFYYVELFFTLPIFNGLKPHYYDINQYLEILTSCLRTYTIDFDRENSITLRNVLESLLERNALFVTPEVESIAISAIKDFYYWFDDKEKGDLYAQKHIDILYDILAANGHDDPSDPFWPVTVYSELATSYASLRKFDNSKAILKKCLAFYQLNDNTHTDINNIYGELTWIADKEDNKNDFRLYAPLFAESTKTAYLERTFGMTKNERLDYYYILGLPYLLGWFAHKSLYDESLAGLCYDIALYHKGFLLNHEREIIKNISECPDSLLTAAYQRYVSAILSGSQDVYDKECDMMDLYSTHLEFKNTTTDIKWQDIQAELKKGEIAIEFVLAEKLASDESEYSAVLIRKDWEQPKIIRIAKETDIKSLVSKTATYSPASNAYSLVWKPLEPYMKGIKKIYFAPDGFLYQLNIELFTDDKGRLANEKFDIYRLSSTGLLCNRKGKDQNSEYDSAVLFGGLNYNAELPEHINNQQSREMNYSYNELSDSLRYGWSNLSGTATEVHDIANILEAANVVTSIHEQDKGTEKVFKSISFSDVSIIHIATHGFYIQEKDVQKNKFFSTRTMSPKSTNPMSRAGLVLSGGQHAWLGENENIQDGDDGILTAAEISGMNLFGTDLVVLSACQTALGEISRDGVFGLQRGFKLAGVNTIVMSLWEVNDQVTTLMMTEFYKNLLSGKTKREAFNMAQLTIRKRYEKRPDYWAAFIMLDSI